MTRTLSFLLPVAFGTAAFALGGPPATHFATAPAADAFKSPAISGHAFFLAGLATDLSFASPAIFVEYDDGTARLLGTVASESNPTFALAVDLSFAGRVDPPGVPAGSPKLDLLPTAYLANGGPVDPATWRYYTSFGGSLTGLDGIAGATFSVTRMGPAFQVGNGAGGVSAGESASGWMTITTLTQPNVGPHFPAVFTGDGAFDLRDDSTNCAEEAITDGFATSPNLHALWLPGIGTDFQFDPSGQFLMKDDGTARLTGIVRSKSNPTWLFDVDVTLGGKIVPGDVGHAPAGSPKKELHSNAYVENGGAIDAATWLYYTTTDGTLTGLGDLAGGKLSLTRVGPAFQVGLGANGKNVEYGGSGWLTVTTMSQPSGNVQFPNSLQGDFNLDLRADCLPYEVDQLKITAASYGLGCAGAGGFVPALALGGALVPGGLASLDLSSATGNRPAFLLLGLGKSQLPIGHGCDLLVAPLLPIVGGPVLTTGNGAGAGAFSIPIQLPFTPLPGALTIQAAIVETTGRPALSNAVELKID
jgi:hypothetical protein